MKTRYESSGQKIDLVGQLLLINSTKNLSVSSFVSVHKNLTAALLSSNQSNFIVSKQKTQGSGIGRMISGSCTTTAGSHRRQCRFLMISR